MRLTMNIVYLFRESCALRVPFYSYNPDLFRLLTDRGGYWDKAKQEFIFRHDINVKNFNETFRNIPFAVIEENNSINYYLINCLWEKAINDTHEQIIYSERNDTKSFSLPDFSYNISGHPSLPEKFSEYWRIKLETELKARKYSLQTQKAYIYYNRLICRTLQKTPEDIQSDDVTEFLALMEKSKDYSASSINLAISSIKFFFKNILNNDDINEQHRPHHDKLLPMVLSKEEIGKIFCMEKNPKHRLLLMLVYSSGLRVSEVVVLKKENIDISRQVIYIKLAKGRKDRVTLLSEKAIQYIKEYYDMYKIDKWLFPGQSNKSHLSIRSAQYIFDKAIRNAGITKKISIHGLRHTFATHLLESGTDIRYIQSLLGHSNIRTTERYTHVACRNILKIKSPLDSIL